VLPNAFIIGAAKCGTTSLWVYLAQHPEVAVSRDKEPALFVHDDYRDRLEWYESLFDPAPIRAEASVQYTMHPVFRGVPERIHNLVPDAKLIYMVRDPVDRAISHYVEYVAHRYEDRPIGEALGDPDETRNQYIVASRYATQAKRYLDRFPRSSLMIVDQAELREDPAETLSRIFRFLSVDDGFSVPRVEVKVSDQRRRLGPLGERVRDQTMTQAALRGIARVLPPPTATRVVGVLKRPFSGPRIERPRLDPAQLDELRAGFRPEANWLREYTGNPLSSWSC